jgi:hypothetical protein
MCLLDVYHVGEFIHLILRTTAFLIKKVLYLLAQAGLLGALKSGHILGVQTRLLRGAVADIVVCVHVRASIHTSPA